MFVTEGRLFISFYWVWWNVLERPQAAQDVKLQFFMFSCINSAVTLARWLLNAKFLCTLCLCTKCQFIHNLALKFNPVKYVEQCKGDMFESLLWKLDWWRSVSLMHTHLLTTCSPATSMETYQSSAHIHITAFRIMNQLDIQFSMQKYECTVSLKKASNM